MENHSNVPAGFVLVERTEGLTQQVISVPVFSTPQTKTVAFFFSDQESEFFEAIKKLIVSFTEEYKVNILFSPLDEIDEEIRLLGPKNVVGIFFSPDSYQVGITALYMHSMGAIPVSYPKINTETIHQGKKLTYTQETLSSGQFDAHKFLNFFQKNEHEYTFGGRITEIATLSTGGTEYTVEILVNCFVPTHHADYCFTDFNRMEKTILFLLSKEMKIKSLAVKEINYKMEKALQFSPGERRILVSKITVTKIDPDDVKDYDHCVYLQFLDDDTQNVFTAEEILVITFESKK